MVFEEFFSKIGGSIFLEIFLATVILFIGISIGKFVAYILSKIVRNIDIEKETKPSFLKLIITVIKWSIYIVFVNLALSQFSIPQISGIVTKVLVVVPALTAALILIGIGFAIAIYLREVVEDSEVEGWKTLAAYIYYFVLYVFGVYALNLALISIDPLFKNILIVLLTTIVGVSIAFVSVKKHLAKH